MDIIKINKIERSKRKTIALLVNLDSTLTVKAPFYLPTQEIDKVIDKKRNWIIAKVKQAQRKPKPVVREFVNGEGFLYLGKSYRLRINNTAKISLGDNLFFPKAKIENIREELVEWYKQQATHKFNLRAKWYAKKMGVNYSSIKLSSAQKRWGSCGRNNVLSFNWRLVMAPLKVLDYVVVHELTHIEYKNHSAKYWNKVRTLLPNYKQAKDWLKENGHILNI